MTSSIEQLAGRKILFATISTDAHIDPLTGLAKYLQDKGCDVRWYASRHYTPKFQQLHIYNYIPRKHIDVHGQNVNEIHPERTRITGRIARINYDMINIFAKPAVKQFEDIRSIHEVFPFDVLIADVMYTAAPLVREILGVPVIVIGVVPLTESSRDLPPYGMGMTPSRNPFGRLKQAALRYLADKVLFKRSYSIYEQIIRKYGVRKTGANILDSIIKNADLVLQIGTPGMDYQRTDLGSNIRYVGAMLPYSTKEGGKWFDERLTSYSNIILVTQGTLEKDISKLVIPAIETFYDTNVLVIVTTGGTQTATLREKYPYRNIIIEDYIPFNDIMPYASVFITNGGYGGVLLSLQNSLPLIVAGADKWQQEIAARIGYRKYGINLHTDRPSRTAISEAFKEIIKNPSYKANISRLTEEFKQYDPIPLSAAYVAELLTR